MSLDTATRYQTGGAPDTPQPGDSDAGSTQRGSSRATARPRVVALTVISVLAIVGLFTSPALAALVAAVAVVIVAVPPAMPPVLRTTAGLLASSLLIMIAAFGWGAAGLAWSPWVFSGPILMAGLFWALARPAKLVHHLTSWNWTRPDTANGVLAAVLTLPPLVALLTKPPLSTAATLGAAVDHLNHLSITRGIALLDGYLFWDPATAVTVLYGGHIGYPQGFHMVTATVAEAAGDAGSALDIVPWYAGVSLLWFAALFVLSGTLAGRVWTALSDRPTGRGPMLAAAIVAIAFLLPPIAELVTHGFPTQNAALTFLLAMILAATYPPGPRAFARFLTLLVLTMGVTVTWWFATPVAGVVLLAWLARHRGALRGQWLRVVLWSTLVGLLSVVLTPGLRGALFSVGSSGPGVLSTSVNTDGNIGSVPWLATGLILLLSGVGALMQWRVRPRNSVGTDLPTWPIWTAVLAAMSLAGVVAVYQLLGEGGFSYYFNKSLHVLIVVALPLAAAALSVLGRALFTALTKHDTSDIDDSDSVMWAPWLLPSIAGFLLLAISILSVAGPISAFARSQEVLTTDQVAYALDRWPTSDAPPTEDSLQPYILFDMPDDSSHSRWSGRLAAVLLDHQTGRYINAVNENPSADAAVRARLLAATSNRSVVILTDNPSAFPGLVEGTAMDPRVTVELTPQEVG